MGEIVLTLWICWANERVDMECLVLYRALGRCLVERKAVLKGPGRGGLERQPKAQNAPCEQRKPVRVWSREEQGQSFFSEEDNFWLPEKRKKVEKGSHDPLFAT